jgi:hypothetical protein
MPHSPKTSSSSCNFMVVTLSPLRFTDLDGLASGRLEKHGLSLSESARNSSSLGPDPRGDEISNLNGMFRPIPTFCGASKEPPRVLLRFFLFVGGQLANEAGGPFRFSYGCFLL